MKLSEIHDAVAQWKKKNENGVRLSPGRRKITVTLRNSRRVSGQRRRLRRGSKR